MTDQEKIKDKIRKLLALQKSATNIGSLEEAQNAAAQIRKLSIKYNIDAAAIEKEMDKKEDEVRIGVQRIFVHEIIPYNKTHGTWLTSLYNVVAKYNFCKVINITGDVDLVVIDLWGDEWNVEIVKDLSFNYAKQVIELEKKRWKSHGEPMGEKRNSFRRAYYNGAVIGLASTFRSQEDEIAKDVSNETNQDIGNVKLQMNQLVRRNELIVEEKVKEHYENLKKSRPISNKSQVGAQLGYQDGKNLEGRRSLQNGRLLE